MYRSKVELASLHFKRRAALQEFAKGLFVFVTVAIIVTLAAPSISDLLYCFAL